MEILRVGWRVPINVLVYLIYLQISLSRLLCLEIRTEECLRCVQSKLHQVPSIRLYLLIRIKFIFFYNLYSLLGVTFRILETKK